MDDDRAIVRRANRAGKERPLRAVVPGCWVYSHGRAEWESWSQVTTATKRRDDSGRQVVRLDLIDRKGRALVIEAPAGAPAWCLDARTAARIGL